MKYAVLVIGCIVLLSGCKDKRVYAETADEEVLRAILPIVDHNEHHQLTCVHSELGEGVIDCNNGILEVSGDRSVLINLLYDYVWGLPPETHKELVVWLKDK